MTAVKTLILRLLRWGTLLWVKRRGVECGEGVLLNGVPYVRRKGSGRIILESGVTINASRWGNWLGTPGAMILSVEDGAKLVLRRGCGVSSCQIVANVGIEIGEETLIGAGCLICDSDMHEVPLGSGREVRKAPIRIGARVFVGARSILLKGITIGDGAVVGAGSVVTADVPPGVLVAGNPAVVIKVFADVAGAAGLEGR